MEKDLSKWFCHISTGPVLSGRMSPVADWLSKVPELQHFARSRVAIMEKFHDVKYPSEALKALAETHGLPICSAEFAAFLDEMDPLREFRSRFQYPRKKDLPLDVTWEGQSGEECCLYLCGNSLGLKPRKADDCMKEQLENWGKWGVFMHTNGELGAAYCDLPSKSMVAKLVGARFNHEVCSLNGLTVNLHLAVAAFYKPEGRRRKILLEAHAFPSDRYALASVVELKGLSPEDNLIQIKPREGEETFRTQDILKAIEDQGDEIALVIFSGLQYYTGQLFDIEAITKAGHSKGCVVGWDLAHAVGNSRLKLHDWGVDFAVWCNYKYLNSGAGGVAGLFLHNRYALDPPKHLHGWWGNKYDTRFDMAEKIDLDVGADSFRLTNPSPWHACLQMASLEIFEDAGLDRILAKQFLLTGLLEYLIDQRLSDGAVTVHLITPRDPKERGSQLSLVFSEDVRKMYDELKKMAVVCDYRYPNVIRIAPTPLYNSYQDVYKFVMLVESLLAKMNVSLK